MRRYLFWLFNLAVGVSAGVAIRHGAWQTILDNDPTFISASILVAALGVFVFTLHRAWTEDIGTPRYGYLEEAGDTFMFVGLIGTVYGFITAFGGVEPTAAADASRVAPMVAQLIRGMNIALYTTLTGAISCLWFRLNFYLCDATE